MAFLVSKYFLGEVVKHVEAKHSRDDGDKGILLQLVLEDRGLGFAIRTDTQSLLGVLHGCVDHSLEGAHGHGCDA